MALTEQHSNSGEEFGLGRGNCADRSALGVLCSLSGFVTLLGLCDNLPPSQGSEYHGRRQRVTLAEVLEESQSLTHSFQRCPPGGQGAEEE